MSLIATKLSDSIPPSLVAGSRAAAAREISRLQINWRELVIVRLLLLCALISVLTTIAIVTILVLESAVFFREIPFSSYLFGTEWSPLIEPRSFGVIPLLMGTFLVSVGACVIAVPLGLGSAVYLAEYASARTRRWLKPIIELLAGVPSVVFGYFAVTTVTPMLQVFLPSTEVFNAASAAIVLAFMVLPTITSLCDDAIRAVPKTMREGGYALAATKHEVSLYVLIPSSLSGILAACILGFSRAIGETMAVALAAGSTPNLSFNPLASAQTMTGYIVQVSMGDTPHGSIEYQSIFAVAMTLFIITLALNMTCQSILKRVSRSYD
ncbi:MAG: phosphate ABC transporter permease subunit PstC [Proteobacteria bacterium]|nr:phosphate ABC transporter permease subunit PstC [Pseudomonadota bacterium]